MKSVISICIVALLATATVYAKDNRGPQGAGPKGPDAEQMIASLQLDDVKAEALKTLIEQHIVEIESMRDSNAIDDNSRREMHERYRLELTAILGEEKMAQFEQTTGRGRPQRGPR